MHSQLHRTRRSVAALASAGLIAVSLVACSTVSDTTGDNNTSAAPSTNELTFTGSGGVTQEAVFKSELEPFGQKFGITITQDSPVDVAKLKVMIESGNVSWDVLHTSPFLVLQNCGTLFEPIDTSIVDQSKSPAELLSKCATPSVLSAQMIYYNTDKFKTNPPKSWNDFFDTKKFPGKRGISKTVSGGAVEAALLADGVSPKDLYPLDYKRAFAKLDTIRDSLVFWETGAQQQQQIESGQVDLTIGWPGRAHGAVVNGAHFEPVWQACLYLPDVYAVAKNAPNKVNAMKFINYAISAGPQAKNSDLVPYASINSEVEPSTDPVISKFAPTLQKRAQYKDGVTMNMQWWADNMAEMVKVWTAWITA